RRTPVCPLIAAVVSDAHEEPMKTPCSQSKASLTSGIVFGRRPPNRMAESGTPSGLGQSGSITGHCAAGAVKREFGCAPFRFDSAIQGCPSQSMPVRGGGTPIPSHQTSPLGVSTTLVKSVFRAQVASAFGLFFSEVLGATP